MKRFGFTLAEVLITLGVIGVVAALTIPALVSKHEKHIIENGLKKTYSDLENLIKRSEVDNGSYETWDYTNPDNFIEQYIKPYINLTDCPKYSAGRIGQKTCFAGTYSGYSVWKYPNQKDISSGNYLVMRKYLLNDGRSLAIDPRHQATIDNSSYWDYVTFIVDVNGQRGKSIMGIDVFEFTLFNYSHNRTLRGLQGGTIGSGDGDYPLSTQSIYNSCKPDNNSGTHKCVLLLQRNGWKFPKDYPIKF